uniref:Receptor protein-tyrosine kinase n=1 Tax=Caenorhabditis japonica TaxID=281687 RepID=A0A8R1HNW3_CAEJA
MSRWRPAFLFLALLVTSSGAGDESTTISSASTTKKSAEGPHLTTDDEGFLTVIQGFATQLQCVLNTCSNDVVWYKDGTQISKGAHFLNTTTEHAYKFQHSIEVDYEKGCSGECDDSNACGDGLSCVDNQCCSCKREEFTLVLRNLTFEESGRYRCQLGNKSELLEFQVEVLESGLKGGFHENISYDHSECCQEKGISPLCRGMCKPSEMDQYHFDPTSCKTDDYKHFLSCATDGGTRSHVHCCKTQLVPSFCYDFCSGDFQMLRRSHRLCLYYLPEIFSCLDRAYLPYPDPPRSIEVNAVDHDKLSVCWQEPEKHESNKMFPVIDYAVYYKEIPNFPLLGGDMGLPLLTGDYSDIGDIQEDEYQQEEEDAEEVIKDATIAPRGKRHVDFESDGVKIRVREKRSTMVIVTRDDVTNSTTIREFAFRNVNTTEKCVTLSDLRSATRYIVYVTARNEYGTSVPSVRNIAATNVHMIKNNDSLPDAMKCCTSANVSSFCATKMCNVAEDPSSFSTITIATTCRAEWPRVSPCIADGRNHTDCCLRKGVQHDCLEICSGSTKELGVHSVLCLNLDLQAIYQCIRQGYETHPSPPGNVTISELTAHSVTVLWTEPDSNAHLVENYTLFIRKNEHGEPVKTVRNVISPHSELGLDPDTEYVLTLQSHSSNGTSLPSTAKLFSTLPTTRPPLCTIGEPIYMNDGKVMICDSLNTCPNGFRCTGAGTDLSYCCPHDGTHSSEDFLQCCKDQKMPDSCLGTCHYNATLGADCKENLNIWVQCASEGHDHLRCCLREQVSKPCQSACMHPFTVPADECFEEVGKYRTCFTGAHLALPAAVRNLEVTSITKDSATISWEDLEANIIVFRVQLFEKDRALLKTVNSSADIYRFSDLEAKKDYSVRVTAINLQGEGPPSWNVTFTTKPSQLYEADRPVAPDGLRVAWNSGPRVNVTWNRVTVRRNDDPVTHPIEYTLYYLDTEQSSTWTTVKSNNTWVVMRDLRKDALFYVYVTAKEENRTSRSSSIITILASKDSLGLPEPQISIEPDHKDGVFSPGDKMAINCSLPNTKQMHLNIDLTVGPQVVQNDHGAMWVILETEADETMDTATCAVSDTDGRQHVAMKHLVLERHATVTMKKEKIRVLDDQSVEIECLYRGGGKDPKISFQKEGKKATRGFLNVKKTEAGYVAKWHIRKVKQEDAGFYKCLVASGDGTTLEATAELIFSTETLPVNPKIILQCCEDEGITGDCLQACNIGRVALSGKTQNCTQFAASLLKCATDIRDHSDCCIASGVTPKCLPLCSGDSFSPDVDCSDHAVSIMSCFVKSHEHAPTQVSNVRVKSMEEGKVLVEWDYPLTRDYKYFAVYYRKAHDDDDDWHKMKTLVQSIELEVDSREDYEVGILAANALGHSRLTYAAVPKDSEARPSTSKGFSSVFWIIVILGFCVAFIAGMAVLSKRRELPYPFGKLIRRRNDLNQPTVAFENPAYGEPWSGAEVEIRGLGTNGAAGAASATQSEWQSANLEANSTTDNSHEYRNGMRYAKLET